MKLYYEYLKYVLEHKKNVFKTCRKRGLKLHALTHDLSKFSPSEFIPYAIGLMVDMVLLFKIN